MKSTTSLLLLAALTTAFTAYATYNANFGNGSLPKGMTTRNANDLRPLYTAYGVGFTVDGWTVDRFGNQFVAMTPTYTGEEKACENILTLPELEIADGENLVWSARSALADFPESYKVQVVDGGNVTVIAEVTDEAGTRWASHVAPLQQFAGKKVSIQFVATSVNRFMLMVNSIKVAAPEAPEFFVTDNTERYATLDGTYVSLEALNTGAKVEGAEVVCLVDGEETDRIGVDSWAAGETLTFSLDAPTELNKRSSYSVVLKKGDNEIAKLASGTYFSSYYKRTLLVDEGTGLWCVNCPAGMLQLQKLQQQFGEQVITLASHTNDVLANNGYFSNLGMHAIPNMMLNRVKSSMSANTSSFEFLYDRPTPFAIEVRSTTVGDDEAEVKVRVYNASGIDNNADRYRVGYVLTSTFYYPGDAVWNQSNNCTTPSYEQYYLLPSKIPSDLIKYHHTTLTSDNAFDGFAGSLPATLEAGQGYEWSWSIKRPNLLKNLRDGEVVAYIIDTEDGHIENAVRVSLEKDVNGIGQIAGDTRADNGVGINCRSGRIILRPTDATDCQLTIRNTAGATVFSRRMTLTEATAVEPGLDAGIYIISVSTPKGVSTVKATL